MGFISLDSLGRTTLLVCDECDGVLMPSGRTTTKKHRNSSPSELAPMYGYQEDLLSLARSVSWSEKNGRWTCRSCRR